MDENNLDMIPEPPTGPLWWRVLKSTFKIILVVGCFVFILTFIWDVIEDGVISNPVVLVMIRLVKMLINKIQELSDQYLKQFRFSPG